MELEGGGAVPGNSTPGGKSWPGSKRVKAVTCCNKWMNEHLFHAAWRITQKQTHRHTDRTDRILWVVSSVRSLQTYTVYCTLYMLQIYTLCWLEVQYVTPLLPRRRDPLAGGCCCKQSTNTSLQPFTITNNNNTTNDNLPPEQSSVQHFERTKWNEVNYSRKDEINDPQSAETTERIQRFPTQLAYQYYKNEWHRLILSAFLYHFSNYKCKHASLTYWINPYLSVVW